MKAATTTSGSPKHPAIEGKDAWSAAPLQALLDNGASTRETWPATLATPEKARAWGEARTPVWNYPCSPTASDRRYPTTLANQKLASWLEIRAWGYDARRWPQLNTLVPLAAVAEMCDRTRYDVGADDFCSFVLVGRLSYIPGIGMLQSSLTAFIGLT
ncbi:MAG: hypothetical protein ABFD77_11485 [Thermotogota bacterium]